MHIKRLSAITISSAQVSVPLSLSPRKKEIDFQALYKKLQKKGFKYISNRYGNKERTFVEITLDLFNNCFQSLKDRAAKKVDPDAAQKKIYVAWGSAVVGNGPVCLGTDGIASCAALSIVDPTHDNIHYMLHAYSSTLPNKIQASLQKAKALGINLKDSEIEIMPGSSLKEDSTPHILEGIYLADSNLLDKIVLIRDRARSGGQAIIVYEGKTFGLHCSAKIPQDEVLGKRKTNTNTLDKDGVEVVLMSDTY